jgi:hypothetical protein
MEKGLLPEGETRMKKILLVVALVCLIVLPLSAAKYDKSDGIGVGLSLGYPVNGAAVKYGMGDFRIVGTLGYSFPSSLSLEGGIQYDLTEFEIENIPFYVNIGGTVAMTIGGGLGLSVNVPVGVSYFFEAFDEYPMEVFFKLAPGFAISPTFGFQMGGAIGALYYLD